MRPYLWLVALGVGLVTVAGWFGGRASAIGGSAAVMAQLAAVRMLRPTMRAAQPVFLARWLSGIGIRALVLGLVLTYAATHRGALDPLAASLGYLGALLPLLFVEIRFLR